MAGNDRKLSSFDEMGYDNSTKVLIPALKYSSNDPDAQIENRNIPLELFYKQPLFKYDWYEYLLNNPNWIRCDTFSWHSGDSQEANSYEKVYQHLVDDIDGKTLQSETISGITIQFYLADDTHKICPASEEQNLINLYNTTGIAWYYLIDEENIRFKLPRTKFGFEGITSSVGNNTTKILDGTGYPEINTTGRISIPKDTDYTLTEDSWIWWGNTTYVGIRYLYVNGIEIGHSYGNSGHWEEFNSMLFPLKAGNVIKHTGGNSLCYIYPTESNVKYNTQMYLYCYIGGFTQTSLENIAGQNMSIVNQKADTDLNNVNNNIDFIIDSQEPTAENNYTWYKLYKSGRVEQGGRCNAVAYNSGTKNVNFLIEMADINYYPNSSPITDPNNDRTWNISSRCAGLTTTSMTVRGGSNANAAYTGLCSWEVKGKANLT